MSIPVEITLTKTTPQQLRFTYADAQTHELSSEYLRISSPSAEVQGHGAGQEKLQHGKKSVTITSIEPVGNYAIRLVFSDGHNSGIYRWAYLQTLITEAPQRWSKYLADLAAAGKSREVQTTAWYF